MEQRKELWAESLETWGPVLAPPLNPLCEKHQDVSPLIPPFHPRNGELGQIITNVSFLFPPSNSEIFNSIMWVTEGKLISRFMMEKKNPFLLPREICVDYIIFKHL